MSDVPWMTMALWIRNGAMRAAMSPWTGLR